MKWLSVEEQLRIIKQGTEELIPEDEMLQKLQKAVAEDRPLRIKQGFDPTAPDVHLGHTIGLRKLRQFQELGHWVVLIIGDYTGMVGDPSGLSETRPQLEHEEVLRNAKTYEDQFFKIVDKSRTEVRFNGEWFSKMSFMDVMELASRVTVARLLERDDFANRYEKNLPISLHELYYPLMQAYDSVAVRADVELGATEQKFNLLMGRHFQQMHGQEPQIVLTLPVLTGTDGVQRMSKSLGNYVGITESPSEIFGKIMSIPDSLVMSYFEFLTPISPAELERKARALESGEAHPRELKGELAETIVRIYQGAEPAARAREEFDRVFKDRGVPDEVSRFELEAPGGKLWIVNLLKETGLSSSGSEARRLVRQGAVEVDGVRITDEDAEVGLEPSREILVKVGKRRFARVRVRSEGPSA
ncbi:MAG: tyrosyl-tRNA synthetase [Latescibacteria bacterium DG_63]|nr:MAG: tyrosyl-tRNA synthetase [Latescibacteria bacterium DG_63]